MCIIIIQLHLFPFNYLIKHVTSHNVFSSVSCGELSSQTTFYNDRGEASSSFEVQYTLTDSLVTANLVSYTRPKFDRNLITAISVNRDISNSNAAPGKFSDCSIPGSSSNVSCSLKIKNNLYLDSSYNFVISNAVDGTVYGAVDGRLIRRNDTWVTPDYTLYSIDNPCWQRNASASNGSVAITSSTKICCTRFNLGSIGNRNNVNLLTSLGLIYVIIVFMQKMFLL